MRHVKNSRVCSEQQKSALQYFYLAARELLARDVLPPLNVQRSFEAALAGVTGEDSWRPTHISKLAMMEAVNGSISNIQRAHGVLAGRLDRYDRTIDILTGAQREFDVWWEFYMQHDKTILITRGEHGSGKRFTEDELFELPLWAEGMFTNSGFSFKLRKKQELVWIKNKLAEFELKS